MADDRPLVPIDELIAAIKSSDTGSKDRATVALVDAKVDGLKDLVRAEFANVRDDVRAISSIAGQVIKLEVTVDDHERRVTAIETGMASRRTGDRDWRRVNLPSLIISGSVAVGSLVAFITQIKW